MRLSVGASNVRTGNFTYFDTMTHTIGPAHVMSKRRPSPGFPAVEIDGEHYWTVHGSNTPCNGFWNRSRQRDTLAFQVDCGAHAATFHGALLKLRRDRRDSVLEPYRANSDRFRQEQRLRARSGTC